MAQTWTGVCLVPEAERSPGQGKTMMGGWEGGRAGLGWESLFTARTSVELTQLSCSVGNHRVGVRVAPCLPGAQGRGRRLGKELPPAVI